MIESENFYAWNDYRTRNPSWVPDLSSKTFTAFQLGGFDLSGAILFGTKIDSTFDGNVDLAVSGAVFDAYTDWPYGFDAISAGAIFTTEAELDKDDHTQPVCFISYAWADDDVVNAIDSWLTQRGVSTKKDKRDFFAGARIRDEIMRVMKQCDVILIFRSQESANRAWPQFEQELAGDLEMAARQDGDDPPRIIYVVIDESILPSVTELNKIAIMAKGKRFDLVCEEIYHSILQLPRDTEVVDLTKWEKFVF